MYKLICLAIPCKLLTLIYTNQHLQALTCCDVHFSQDLLDAIEEAFPGGAGPNFVELARLSKWIHEVFGELLLGELLLGKLLLGEILLGEIGGGRLNGWVAFQFGLRVLIWILWGICYTVAPQMWRPVSVTSISCFRCCLYYFLWRICIAASTLCTWIIVICPLYASLAAFLLVIGKRAVNFQNVHWLSSLAGEETQRSAIAAGLPNSGHIFTQKNRECFACLHSRRM